MELRSIVLTRLLPALLAAVFVFQVYRAVERPIRPREAYLYDRFVRPTSRQVWESELPNGDVLYTLLEKRSVGLFHVSPWAVRLPSVLCAAVYLWIVWLLARRWPGAIVLAVLPLVWDGFSRADGTGAAAALCLCAIQLAVARKYLNWIGICLGLSISAQMAFAVPASGLALAILIVRRRWDEWCNTVLIPLTVSALIVLVLPISHAHSVSPGPSELSEEQAKHLQVALDSLRAAAGRDHIGISTIPAVEPVVNFYRAQHRAITWERASIDDPSKHFDYYLFSAAQEWLLEERHLIVVYRDRDFVLARPAVASM